MFLQDQNHNLPAINNKESDVSDNGYECGGPTWKNKMASTKKQMGLPTVELAKTKVKNTKEGHEGKDHHCSSEEAQEGIFPAKVNTNFKFYPGFQLCSICFQLVHCTTLVTNAN